MDTSYTWELTSHNMSFFDGDFVDYEDSSGYTLEEMQQMKHDFVKGATIAFREVAKLINGTGCPVLIKINRTNETYQVYLNAGSIFVANVTTNESPYSFGPIKTTEELRTVIHYMTELYDYLPINIITAVNMVDVK